MVEEGTYQPVRRASRRDADGRAAYLRVGGEVGDVLAAHLHNKAVAGHSLQLSFGEGLGHDADDALLLRRRREDGDTGEYRPQPGGHPGERAESVGCAVVHANEVALVDGVPPSALGQLRRGEPVALRGVYDRPGLAAVGGDRPALARGGPSGRVQEVSVQRPFRNVPVLVLRYALLHLRPLLE